MKQESVFQDQERSPTVYDGKLLSLKVRLRCSLVVVSYPFRHETATRKTVKLRGTEVYRYRFQESAKTMETLKTLKTRRQTIV